MKAGDLVKLKEHCRGSGRLAMVVESPDMTLSLHCVKIMFLDNGRKLPATRQNLELISEGR